MNIIRKAGATLGGIFLAVLLIAVFAPKATRGVVAALVQVTNTSANPVPTVSVSNLVPFGANLCLETSAFSCQPNTYYFLVPQTTPAGLPVKWLVIDQVDGSCFTFNSVSNVTPQITFGFPNDNSAPGTQQLFFYFPMNLTAIGGDTRGTFQSPVRIYVPANYFVYGSVNVQPNGVYANCGFSILGHLETN